MPARLVQAAAQGKAPSFVFETARDHCITLAAVKQGRGLDQYRECGVSEFGEVGTAGGTRYYYALYCLIPNHMDANVKCGDGSFMARYERARAVVIFARNRGDRNMRLEFERADPDIGMHVYERPEIVQNSVGALLYLPIAVDGTGHFNDSEYYVNQSGRWEPIESKAWLSDARKREPAFRPIKGVWPNVHTMRAESAIYRLGDANCCPTGGTVRVQLAIESRRFVLKSLVVDRTPEQ